MTFVIFYSGDEIAVLYPSFQKTELGWEHKFYSPTYFMAIRKFIVALIAVLTDFNHSIKPVKMSLFREDNGNREIVNEIVIPSE